MGQCVIALETPIVGLLNYELQNVEEDEDIEISIDRKENNEENKHNIMNEENKKREKEIIKRIAYERQLSKSVNDNYTRKTRKEMLFPIIHFMYPKLNIPYEILDLILDFEQNDCLEEIFTLFETLKTETISNIYVMPYILGWIEMLIFGYLSSEYWEGMTKKWNHLLLLQIFGMILTFSAVIQLIGCYFCIKLNTKQTYSNKLINLKCSFFINNLYHSYDKLHYIHTGDIDNIDNNIENNINNNIVAHAWELYIPLQKWCNALRVQNIYNVRNTQSKPIYVIAFYLLKPIFCFILGIQLFTLSEHCLIIWLLFYLYFCILISINVFNKSIVGSFIGCTILILIISATSINLWPHNFEHGLRLAFEIFVFLIFLLYLFSLYLICCSGSGASAGAGRVSSNHASSNMLSVWLLLFSCYCLWVSEVLTTTNRFNFILLFSIYLLYISLQLLLLTASDLQSSTAGINCYYQIKFMFIAILCGWIVDIDTLSSLYCSSS